MTPVYLSDVVKHFGACYAFRRAIRRRRGHPSGLRGTLEALLRRPKGTIIVAVFVRNRLGPEVPAAREWRDAYDRAMEAVHAAHPIPRSGEEAVIAALREALHAVRLQFLTYERLLPVFEDAARVYAQKAGL